MEDTYRRPHPKHPKLIIFKRDRSPFYQGRAFVGGRLRRKSFKTDDLERAERLGEGWYRKLLRGEEADSLKRKIDKAAQDPIMAELLASYKAGLATEAQRTEAQQRWSPIKSFWGSKIVTDITASTFDDFFKWRRRTSKVKNHTLHKDVILIRQVLKYAAIKGHIQQLPLIPSAGKIKANPRPWLTEAEWTDLESLSRRRLRQAQHGHTDEDGKKHPPNPKVFQQRQDLHDEMCFLISSMARVDDVKTVRFRDCRAELVNGRNILICEMGAKGHPRRVVTTPLAAENRPRLTSSRNKLIGKSSRIRSIRTGMRRRRMVSRTGSDKAKHTVRWI